MPTLTAGFRNIIILATVLMTLFLVTHPLDKAQYGPVSDEGYYYRYAEQVKEKGLPAFNELIHWYASNDEARLHPVPIRAGYILLCAFLFKIFGPSYFILGFLSTISFLAFLILCFYYVRKHYNLDTALLTVLLLSSSPLLLGLSRRALLDSSINLFWGLAVWLFLDLLTASKRWTYPVFVLVICISITIKEMSWGLVPFFVLAALWARHKGYKLSTKTIVGMVFWPLLLASVFYLVILGGPQGVLTAAGALIKTHFVPAAPNSYAVLYSSGPWFRYLLDFLLLTPVVTVAFIGYLGHLVLKGQWDFKTKYFFLYFLYVYTVFSLLPHTKVVRFVANLEMVMTLFTVLMINELAKNFRPQRRQFLGVAIVLGVFGLNAWGFKVIFYDSSLLDPVSQHLLSIRHFIP